MDELKQKLRSAGFHGEIKDDAATKEFYSHDASMFELRPQLVVMPQRASDVEALVKLIASEKKADASLSLTARSAGTDMSGAAINEGVIVDFNKHFTKIENISASAGHAQPGVFYRDFEKETLKFRALMPSYPEVGS